MKIKFLVIGVTISFLFSAFTEYVSAEENEPGVALNQTEQATQVDASEVLADFPYKISVSQKVPSYFGDRVNFLDNIRIDILHKGGFTEKDVDVKVLFAQTDSTTNKTTLLEHEISSSNVTVSDLWVSFRATVLFPVVTGGEILEFDIYLSKTATRSNTLRDPSVGSQLRNTYGGAHSGYNLSYYWSLGTFEFNGTPLPPPPPPPPTPQPLPPLPPVSVLDEFPYKVSLSQNIPSNFGDRANFPANIVVDIPHNGGFTNDVKVLFAQTNSSTKTTLLEHEIADISVDDSKINLNAWVVFPKVVAGETLEFDVYLSETVTRSNTMADLNVSYQLLEKYGSAHEEYISRLDSTELKTTTAFYEWTWSGGIGEYSDELRENLYRVYIEDDGPENTITSSKINDGNYHSPYMGQLDPDLPLSPSHEFSPNPDGLYGLDSYLSFVFEDEYIVTHSSIYNITYDGKSPRDLIVGSKVLLNNGLTTLKEVELTEALVFETDGYEILPTGPKYSTSAVQIGAVDEFKIVWSDNVTIPLNEIEVVGVRHIGSNWKVSTTNELTINLLPEFPYKVELSKRVPADFGAKTYFPINVVADIPHGGQFTDDVKVAFAQTNKETGLMALLEHEIAGISVTDSNISLNTWIVFPEVVPGETLNFDVYLSETAQRPNDLADLSVGYELIEKYALPHEKYISKLDSTELKTTVTEYEASSLVQLSGDGEEKTITSSQINDGMYGHYPNDSQFFPLNASGKYLKFVFEDEHIITYTAIYSRLPINCCSDRVYDDDISLILDGITKKAIKLDPHERYTARPTGPIHSTAAVGLGAIDEVKIDWKNDKQYLNEIEVIGIRHLSGDWLVGTTEFTKPLPPLPPVSILDDFSYKVNLSQSIPSDFGNRVNFPANIVVDIPHFGQFTDDVKVLFATTGSNTALLEHEIADISVSNSKVSLNAWVAFPKLVAGATLEFDVYLSETVTRSNTQVDPSVGYQLLETYGPPHEEYISRLDSTELKTTVSRYGVEVLPEKNKYISVVLTGTEVEKTILSSRINDGNYYSPALLDTFADDPNFTQHEFIPLNASGKYLRFVFEDEYIVTHSSIYNSLDDSSQNFIVGSQISLKQGDVSKKKISLSESLVFDQGGYEIWPTGGAYSVDAVEPGAIDEFRIDWSDSHPNQNLNEIEVIGIRHLSGDWSVGTTEFKKPLPPLPPVSILDDFSYKVSLSQSIPSDFGNRVNFPANIVVDIPHFGQFTDDVKVLFATTGSNTALLEYEIADISVSDSKVSLNAWVAFPKLVAGETLEFDVYLSETVTRSNTQVDPSVGYQLLETYGPLHEEYISRLDSTELKTTVTKYFSFNHSIYTKEQLQGLDLSTDVELSGGATDEKTIVISKINDGVYKSPGLDLPINFVHSKPDYQFHPINASGKYLRFVFEDDYIITHSSIHNRLNCCRDRIVGSSISLKLGGLTVEEVEITDTLLYERDADGHEIWPTGNGYSAGSVGLGAIDEFKITWSNFYQNLNEIEVKGVRHIGSDWTISTDGAFTEALLAQFSHNLTYSQEVPSDFGNRVDFPANIVLSIPHSGEFTDNVKVLFAGQTDSETTLLEHEIVSIFVTGTTVLLDAWVLFPEVVPGEVLEFDIYLSETATISNTLADLSAGYQLLKTYGPAHEEYISRLDSTELKTTVTDYFLYNHGIYTEEQLQGIDLSTDVELSEDGTDEKTIVRSKINDGVYKSPGLDLPINFIYSKPDFQFHPRDAAGKYLRFVFEDDYIITHSSIHNRLNCCRDRIVGSSISLKLGGLTVEEIAITDTLLYERDADGHEIWPTGNAYSTGSVGLGAIDEFRIDWSDNNQNLNEIEVIGVRHLGNGWTLS